MMIEQLLQEQQIKINQEAACCWQAAQIALDLLQQAGCIEKRYSQAAMAYAKEPGAYMVLTKGFALLHARPEDGALSPGISLVTFQHALEFGAGERDPVYVIMAFSHPAPDGHVLLLQELVNYLMRPGFLESLAQAGTVEAVRKLFAS